VKRLAVRAGSAALAAAAIAVVIARRAPETTQGLAPRGPSVGEALPPFEAPDQNGRVQTFDSLRGPQGLVLVFFQSADW
jgi:cytochrome oxidase Cu insertion factor (SCO1/SenC/PrrC family)